MSEMIYNNVIRTETLEMDREEREIMVDIYGNDELMINTENISTETHQPLQHTGSVSVKNRRHRAIQMCLLLLCVLLLTVVIALCVYFITERNQLLTHNYNLTKVEEQLLAKHSEMLNQTRILSEEREELKNKSDELQRGLYEQDQRSDNFKWIYYNFSFYYFSPEWRSWGDSRQDCQQREADLVIINSSEEESFLLKATAGDYFWIGLSTDEEVWKWIDNITLSSRYWMNRYSRPYNNYCAITAVSGWAQSCSSKYKWICERRLLKSLII